MADTASYAGALKSRQRGTIRDMPIVGGKHYSYTPASKRVAAVVKKKLRDQSTGNTATDARKATARKAIKSGRS